MPKYFTIDIPDSCHEDWHSMAPEKSGRHCDSCRKTVIDFSMMTNSQLAEFFKKPKQNVCGRFYSDQLNREILIPKKQVPWLKYFFTVTIPALLWSMKATAQKSQLASSAVQQKTNVRNKTSNILSSSDRTIRSILVDEDGDAIAGASVVVLNSNRGTATDDSGKFALSFSADDKSIKISGIGLEDQIISIDLKCPDTITGKRASVAKDENVTVYSTAGNKTGGYTVGGLSYTVINRSTRKNERIKNTISIFPNPILPNSCMTIGWPKATDADHFIEIFSSGGACVQTERMESFSNLASGRLQLKNLTRGLYFLRVTDMRTMVKISKQFLVQ